MIRIAFIGAGSVVFTRNLMTDILGFPELRGATIALNDIDPERLETAGMMARWTSDQLGAGARVEEHLDRRAALDGADFVINMVQIGMHEATLTDFEIPRKYGLKQTIGDSMGVGGIFRGLRSIPFMLELARDMEELCPDALLLNYTNPMSILTWAVYRAFPDLRVVGLCHNVPYTVRERASYIGVPHEELVYEGAGINHIVWLTRLEHDGEDAYPRLFAAMEAPEVYDRDRVRFELMRRFGFFVSESSEHNAEYTPYFLRDDGLIEEFDVPVDEYIRRSEENLIEYAETRRKLLAGGSFPLERSVEYGSLIIHSLVTDEPRVVYANVRNTGLVTNLLDGCCVERYKDHPALAMWHVNNEYSVHVQSCSCDTSARAFRSWLQDRYGDLGRLNEAWGTAFWSQGYGEWEEILPPRAAPTFPNPTQQLDYHRFSSDALLECFTMERDVLREITPDVPVTSNFLGFPKALDLWKWTAVMDVVSVDLYPDPADPESYAEAAMSHDLMRSLGAGKPFVLMEQTTVRVNWRERNVPKRPGELRLWSLGTVARGADGIMFFQWRQSRAGAEKFHSAMVPHVDPADSRSWQEVKRLGNDLARLDDLPGARGEAETVILLDWKNWWALELDSKPSTAVRLLEGVYSFYKLLYGSNIPVDFVHPESDLSSYELVIAPNLYLVTDGSAHNINRFVADGGTLLMSFLSGIVDAQDHIRLGGYPASFRDLFGLLIEDFVPMATGQTNRLDAEDGPFGCDLWADLIQLRGAELLASYTQNFYAGTPAVTRNNFGRGVAYYLGARPEERYTELLLQTVCEQAGVAPTLQAPHGVDAVRRKTEETAFLFLLNHNEEAVEVRLPEPGRDLLTSKDHDSKLMLDPLGVAVLREASGQTARAR